jgi:uncharacterized UPF0160 family protein
MAWALIQSFLEDDVTVIRTRDQARIDAADIAIDVGGSYDVATCRFDHHQGTYQGPLSAAGMVLEWLEHSGRLSGSLAGHLRLHAFTYLDDVDNGRVAPVAGVPCFPRVVEFLNQPADTAEDFDRGFQQASEIGQAWLAGMVADHDKIDAARTQVLALMDAAAATGSKVLELPGYLRWKAPYFEAGGAEHCTQFCLFPGTDGSYRIVAIPPQLGDFGQKTPLPLPWAGLLDDALSEVIGVKGARFCHKNRFIAVFDTRAGAVEAMEKWGLS